LLTRRFGMIIHNLTLGYFFRIKMTIYFVSDLHIGDGSAKDNFRPNADKFRRFLQMVMDTGSLVCVGDTFELWQCQLLDCARHYSNIYSILIDHSKIIIGNHDSALKLPDRVILGNTLTIHGHQYDKYNKGNAFWGKLITEWYGYVEPIFPKIQLIDRLWRDNEKFITPLSKVAEKEGYLTIIFAHTHETCNEFSNGIQFLNAGCWIGEHCHYIKNENGIYTIHEWTD
jgi:UDP-2,3-diacylglucosamine pyrophosphatase LpxH